MSKMFPFITDTSKYKKCVTYPEECINCSEGQQNFCQIQAEAKDGKLKKQKIPSLLSETLGEDYV